MNISSNFFEIKTTKKAVTVPYIKFEDAETLRNFRIKNPESVFLRSRDQLFIWGEKHIPQADNHKVYQTDQLFSNMLSESLLQQFYQNRTAFRIGRRFHVSRITLLDQQILPNKFEGLSLYKSFHLHFTPLKTEEGIKLGFTISYSITESISWSVADFQKANIDYEDLKYDKVSGQVFINGKSKYRLAHHFGYASQLKEVVDRQNSIQNELKEIRGFVKKYFEDKLGGFTLPDSLEISTISRLLTNLDNKEGTFKNQILKKPDSYFYNGNYPKDGAKFNNRSKARYNKPFTFDEFENRELNLAVIFPSNLYQNVRMFFKYIQKELIDTFRLKKEKFKYDLHKIDNFNLPSYQKEMPLVKNSDLVIVVVDKSHEVLKSKDSPYYFCKAEFIKRGINTQEVQIQQIQKFLSDKNDNLRNYTDHNIALNIYAKLGGMAWTIKPKKPKNELIIGIGATTDRDGQPVLGLTSIFRGDGKYLFGKVASVTSMGSYMLTLERIVSTAIQESIQDGILDGNQPFYLIFHIFKPAGRNNELKALNNVIRKFSNYSFKYAFIHIGTGHNYRFFMFEGSDQQPRFNLTRGFGQNTRGTLIRLNDRKGFLSLQPNNSRFCKIDIHQNSNFIDLDYIANQIYQFTELSHTSYNKQGTPVTIKYPNLMAGFVEKFKEADLMYLNEITMPDNSLWFI